MNQRTATKKIDLPPEHWDRLFAPSACLVSITTVDIQGRINAASFGTCARAFPPAPECWWAWVTTRPRSRRAPSPW